MSDKEPPPRLTRGVVWRRFVAGRSVAGQALGEKAYLTPATSARGIAASDLKRASRETQRQTVIVWFFANCRRYDPADPPNLMGVPVGAAPIASQPTGGGFGQGHFGSGGFGRREPPSQVVSPGPFAAIYPVSLEFAGIVAEELLSDISNELAGEWVWIPPSTPSEALGFFDPGETIIRAELEARLAAVEAAISELRPTYGGIGHNAFSGEPPVSESEEQHLLHDLQQLRHDVKSGAAPDEIATLWTSAAPLLKKFAAWCGARLTFFIDEGISKGGAKWLLAAIAVSHSIPAIEKLIAALSK